MANARTLFERLEASGDAPLNARSGDDQDPVEETLESVRRNLRRLLRARIGMSAALPDYGLPALSDVLSESDGDIQRVLAMVQSTLQKYEPRLQKIQINAIEEEEGATPSHKLRLRIEATLHVDGRKHRVTYQAALDADGGFEVVG